MMVQDIYSNSNLSLHCTLSLVVQCIVIGPVCVCDCLFVGLLPQ